MSRSRDLSTEIGDEHGRANALWGIGNYRYFHDLDDSGIHDFEEARDVFGRSATGRWRRGRITCSARR